MLERIPVSASRLIFIHWFFLIFFFPLFFFPFLFLSRQLYFYLVLIDVSFITIVYTQTLTPNCPALPARLNILLTLCGIFKILCLVPPHGTNTYSLAQEVAVDFLYSLPAPAWEHTLQYLLFWLGNDFGVPRLSVSLVRLWQKFYASNVKKVCCLPGPHILFTLLIL